jgi:hypothetical protein
LKNEIDEIDAIGEDKKPEEEKTETDENDAKPKSEGFLAGLFSSEKSEESKNEESEVPVTQEVEPENDLTSSENADLNNAMIQSDNSSVPSELNNGMIVNDSDSEMNEALKEESEEKAVGGRSRKNRKQKNAKSKKLRGGKRTKRRNQKKGGAKKSKRRA